MTKHIHMIGNLLERETLAFSLRNRNELLTVGEKVLLYDSFGNTINSIVETIDEKWTVQFTKLKA